MIERQQLVNNGMALAEAMLTLAKWDTKEDCVAAMQVLCEVALSSVAMNVDMPRAIQMVADSIAAVGRVHGAEVTVDVMQGPGRCSNSKH